MSADVERQSRQEIERQSRQEKELSAAGGGIPAALMYMMTAERSKESRIRLNAPNLVFEF